MNSKTIGFLILALCGQSMVANAQTETLNYTGSLFTSLTISGNSTNALANAPAQNMGDLVFSSPLADNLNNVAVTPLSYSFNSGTQFGGIYLNSSNPQSGSPGNAASFIVSTDSSGMLTGWNINVTGGIFGGTNSPSFASILISNSGDSFSTGFSTPSCAAPPGVSTPCYTVSENNSARGFFSSTIAAPEIDGASAASGLTLLLGGFAVLRGGRKVSRKLMIA